MSPFYHVQDLPPPPLQFWGERKWKWSLSRVRLFATPWTVAYQASPFMGFSRQGYWSGLPFTSPEYLPDPGIEHGFPTLQPDALPSKPPGKFWGKEVKMLYFPGGSVVKNLPVNAWDVGLIPGEGNDNPLQYYCWEIP